MSRALSAALLGALLGAAALVFDTASLWVPCVALMALGLGSAVWVGLAAVGAGVERETGPPTVEEQAPYRIRLQMTPGWVPPPGGHLYEPVIGRGIPLGKHRRARLEIHFERRGKRLLEPTRLVIEDPLGLARREVQQGTPEELLVLPRVEPVLSRRGAGGAESIGRGGGDGMARELAALVAGAAELELDSLRPYREGTSASRVHWPTVARTGTMMERKLVADDSSAPLVVLDPRSPDSEADLDMAVRAAASLVVALARSGGCALVLPGDRRPAQVLADLHAWPAQHARLALVEATERPPAITRVHRTGAIFWVIARSPSHRRGLPAAFDRAVSPSRWVVSPRPVPGGQVQYTVAGCSIQRVVRGARRVAA